MIDNAIAEDKIAMSLTDRMYMRLIFAMSFSACKLTVIGNRSEEKVPEMLEILVAMLPGTL